MTTSGQADDHRSVITDLVDLALRDLIAFWDSLDNLGSAERAAEVRAYLPILLGAYSAASGSLAADFYDELRANAETAARFMAEPFGDPVPTDLDSLIGWALQPLFPGKADPYLMGPDPDPDPVAALRRLISGSQRLIANADRQTIITNARKDPDAVRYARHARADACAFCALLATRQADFLTAESAVLVTGEIDPRNPQGFPQRGPRGTQQAGEKYHTDCYCVAVPVWPGQELEEAPYVQQWRDAYDDAAAGIGYGASLKAVLASMRENAGLR